MRRPTETVYRVALHAENFFGNYNGIGFEKGCLEPIDFKSMDDALSIAQIQCVNVAACPEYTGKRIITIDKFEADHTATHIRCVAEFHLDEDAPKNAVEKSE